MGVLQRFERRLEGMVTGAFTKAFKAEVQPVEIAAALQRELDNNAQIVTRERSLVPNDFVIELGPHDHERLAPYESTLTAELLELVSITDINRRLKCASTPTYSTTPLPAR